MTEIAMVLLLAAALAFSNGDGTAHWIALPVSDGPVIVASMLEEALRRFCASR